MQRFNTITCQRRSRKILEIKRQDCIRRRCDGGGQNVLVSRIGQREIRDPRLVAGNESIRKRGVHYGVGPRDLRSQLRTGRQEIPLPFVIDVGRPAQPETRQQRPAATVSLARGQSTAHLHQAGRRLASSLVANAYFLSQLRQFIECCVAIYIGARFVSNDIA